MVGIPLDIDIDIDIDIGVGGYNCDFFSREYETRQKDLLRFMTSYVDLSRSTGRWS